MSEKPISTQNFGFRGLFLLIQRLPRFCVYLLPGYRAYQGNAFSPG
jgi:hypothetical protein